MLVRQKHTKILKIAAYLFIATTAIFLLVPLGGILAADPAAPAGLDVGLDKAAGTGLSNQLDIRVIIAKIIRVILGFLGIIAVGLIIYAGWLWMTSAGNEEKIQQAKNILKNAVIGLIIILSAFAIASFILNKLIEATGGGNFGGLGGGGGGGGAGLGLMGGNIVDYTFPANNQKNVPRNLQRMSAVLNEPVVPESFHDKTATEAATAEVRAFTVEPSLYKNDTDNKLASWPATSFLGRLKEKVRSVLTQGWSNISHQALASAAGSETGESTAVAFEVSNDGKILMLKPKQLMGSPKAVVWYTVTLRGGVNGVKKPGPDGKPVDLFPRTAGEVGYRWKFAVGTEIDNTPPKIESVIPRPSTTEPRNVVVQINFSEAIDPTSAAGKLEIAPNSCNNLACLTGRTLKSGGFNNLEVSELPSSAAVSFIAGQWDVSNQYRTVEFLTLDACGLNSCGQEIFCLPAGQKIKVLVKAATLAEPPAATALFGDNGYNGVVDMAGNSLDGNGNGAAQGPKTQSGNPPYNANTPNQAGQGDDYEWTFNTNDLIDKTAPKVMSVTPVLGSGQVGVKETPQAVFSKWLLSSSLTKTSVAFKSADPEFYYWIYNRNNSPVVNPSPTAAASERQTTVYLGHNPFATLTTYSIQFNSGVKDIYQNCYMPCSGVDAKGNPVKGIPSCCEGVGSDKNSCW